MAAAITMGTEYGKESMQANFITLASLAGDDSYPTGGYDLDALLDVVDYMKDHAVIHVIAQEDENYRYVYDATNKKLKFLNLDTGAEIANGTNVAAATAVPLVIFSE